MLDEQTSLNLILKIIDSGAPALSNDLSQVLVNLYSERNKLKEEVTNLKNQLASATVKDNTVKKEEKTKK